MFRHTITTEIKTTVTTEIVTGMIKITIMTEIDTETETEIVDLSLDPAEIRGETESVVTTLQIHGAAGKTVREMNHQ